MDNAVLRHNESMRSGTPLIKSNAESILPFSVDSKTKCNVMESK